MIGNDRKIFVRVFLLRINVIHPPKMLAIIVAGNTNQNKENAFKSIPVEEGSS